MGTGADANAPPHRSGAVNVSSPPLPDAVRTCAESTDEDDQRVREHAIHKLAELLVKQQLVTTPQQRQRDAVLLSWCALSSSQRKRSLFNSLPACTAR